MIMDMINKAKRGTAFPARRLTCCRLIRKQALAFRPIG